MKKINLFDSKEKFNHYTIVQNVILFLDFLFKFTIQNNDFMLRKLNKIA